MKIIGLMLARNEDWVIGLSARVALMWCDALVVIVHRSTDRTWNILEDICKETDEPVAPIEIQTIDAVTEQPEKISISMVNRRCMVAGDNSSEWEEMRLRQTSLIIARQCSATHLAIIDADEVLTGNALPSIRKHVEQLEDGVVLQAPWLQLRNNLHIRTEAWGITDAHDTRGLGVMNSGMWAHQNSVIAFKDHPSFHWAARDGYDFHQRKPMGLSDLQSHHIFDDRSAGVMHLQFLSRRRLLAKQFLYQLTERLRWPGRDSIETIVNRYAPTVRESDKATLAACPESWWAPYSHLMQYLHVDREPWQENECKRILIENPGIERGLDDFGLLAQWEGALK